MSYILDALRKSERERRRDSAATLTGAPQAAAARGTPVWIWPVIGALSVAIVSLTVLLVLPADDSPGPALQAAASARGSAEPRADAPTVVPQTNGAAARGPDPRPRPASELQQLEPGLPDYRLSVLAYSRADPESSSAWINGRRYFVGERLSGGPEIVAIRADGVVLAYAGRQFLLTTR